MGKYNLTIPPLSSLHQRLIDAEGWREKPYRCTEGKLTIGVGHNLDASGLCREAIIAQLLHDCWLAEAAAERVCAMFWDTLTQARKDVLIEMVFQLGEGGVKGFKGMLAALQKKRYSVAAREMLDSKWAAQTPQRCQRLARIMERGTDEH